MKITVQAELPLNAEAYLLERDGAAFRTFIAQEMRLLEYEITECWSEGAATLIRINSKPDVSAWIPGSLAKSIPEKLEYWDEVRYDPAVLTHPPYELTIHSEAPFLGDRGHFESRTLIEPLGPKCCRHVLEQSIEIRGLWGLGNVAKKLARKSLQDSFDEMPALMEKWMQVRQELLQTPHGRERLLAGRPRVQGVAWMDEHVAAIQQHAAPPRKHHLSAQHPGHRAAHGAPYDITAEAGPEPAMPPDTTEPAAEAAASMAAPLPSAFAAAAAEGSVVAGTELEQHLAAGDDGGDGSSGAGAEAEGSVYWGAVDEPSRHSTSGTAYTTPSTSLDRSGSDRPPATQAPARRGGGIGSVKRECRVVVQRLGLDGQPLRSEGAVTPSEGELADRSSSEELEEEGLPLEDWATCAPWRAFYHQRGMQPLRRDLSLPVKLVTTFIPKPRPRPVQVEKLEQAGGSSHTAKNGSKSSRWGDMCAALCGAGSAAVPSD